MFLFNDKNMFLMFFYSKIYLHCEVIRPTAITYRADAVGDIHLSTTTVHHQQAWCQGWRSLRETTLPADIPCYSSEPYRYQSDLCAHRQTHSEYTFGDFPMKTL